MITFFFFKDKEKDTLQNVLEGRDEYGAGGEQRREDQRSNRGPDHGRGPDHYATIRTLA